MTDSSPGNHTDLKRPYTADSAATSVIVKYYQHSNNKYQYKIRPITVPLHADTQKLLLYTKNPRILKSLLYTLQNAITAQCLVQSCSRLY